MKKLGWKVQLANPDYPLSGTYIAEVEGFPPEGPVGLWKIVGRVEHCASEEELPEWMQRKLAVLKMCEWRPERISTAEREVDGVGSRWGWLTYYLDPEDAV